MTPEILIHANTGENVGLGHLVRCVTLTNELLSQGVTADLQLKPDDDAVEFAHSAGVSPTVSPADRFQEDLSSSYADVIVVDSYAFTSAQFEQLSAEKTLVVIDELGDRRIPAKLVVNNNIYAKDISYPTAKSVIRGPDYCMLRKPFRDIQETVIRQHPESVLITVGGSDLADSFIDIVDITASVGCDTTIDAVVGPYFTPPSDAPESVVFHHDPQAIHELMLNADVAVSGGGQTLYELAVCGTPTVALTLGPDQERNIDGFAEAGFCLPAGAPDDPSFEMNFRDQLQTLLNTFETRKRMGQAGTKIVDGLGVVRVADHLLHL